MVPLMGAANRYYISVQPEDLERARTVQADILRGGLTDPKVTHSAKNEGKRGGKARNVSS